MINSPKCPVCSSSKTEIFLKREDVPVHQNLIYRSEAEAVKAPRGRLYLAICYDCGFIFNSTFDLSLLSYGAHYDNKQHYSPFFEDYLNKLVKDLVKKGLTRKSIIEVGCGDGSFLTRLINFPGSNNSGHGFDPSYIGPEEAVEGRLRFSKDYYGAQFANIKGDAFICRHVIEHVPFPSELLRNILAAATHCPGNTIFFETPCAKWILSNNAFWDFFYEHCSYFTIDSLRYLFELSGLLVVSIENVFNGQYLLLEAEIRDITALSEYDTSELVELARQFGGQERDMVREFSGKIAKIGKSGNIAIWGAGAKGVTMANLIDQNKKLISCVVDINPNKQGGYISGTGHPIVDFKELNNYGVTAAISMNPNYTYEINQLLDKENLNIAIIDTKDWGI